MSKSSFMQNQLPDLLRRLRNAKRRAMYWSGLPSFTRKGYVPGLRGRPRSGHAQLEYELAIVDVRSLQSRVEAITGKKAEPYNPRCRGQE